MDNDPFTEVMNNLPTDDDPFKGTLKTDGIPKSENILQRAMSAMQNTMPQMSSFDPSHPFQSALNSTTQGLKFAPGMGDYLGGHEAKSGIMNDAMPDNPYGAMAADFVTDPEMHMGTYGGVKAIGEGVQNVLNPSKVFGRKLESMGASNPKGAIDFYPHIMKALDDPVAGKLIDKAKILERFGGTTLGEGGVVSEKLSNLNPQQSQEVVNALNSEVTKAVREGTLKPKELGVGKLLGSLSDAQNQAFEGFKSAKFGYGLGKNTQKVAKGALNTAIKGSEFGVGGKLGWESIKHLFGF